MNAFVRDGAVNRKKRARLSLTTRSTEPERKKTCKMNVKEATSVPRDLVASTSQTHTGECSDNQSTIVPTEKESRYSNVEFMRARAFLYLNYKKISSVNVNKLLKQHLKQFDENESHLKRIFEQCYDLTGSVEISKAMMKQLETCPRLDLTPNSSSRVSNRLSILPRNVVGKTVEIVKKIKDNKIITTQLKEIIDYKILKLFGKDYSIKDKKILYTNKINDYNTTPKLDNYSDTSVTSDDENYSPIRITKAYSVNNKKNKSSEVTQVNKSNTDGIVQGQSNLWMNNSQSNQVSAKKSISSTNQLNISAYKKFKKNPIVHDTVNSQISSTIMNNVEEKINPRLKTDASVQNAEDFALETVNDVGHILVPQFEIDVIVKNSKGSALENNIDVGEITVPREDIVECGPNAKNSALETNIDIEEIAYPRLIIDECVQNDDEDSTLENNFDVRENVPLVEIDECGPSAKDSALTTNIDIEDIAYPRLIIDECVQNDDEGSLLQTNFDVRENVTLVEIDECGPNAKDPVLETNLDVEEIAYPRLVIDECVQNAESSASETNFDVRENVPLVEKDECVKNSNDNIKIEGRDKCPRSSVLKTNICTGDIDQIVDLKLEQNTCTSEMVNSQINELETDIEDSKTQSEIFDHKNLELKIRKIINPNDKIFDNSTIKDLATYFLNDDFLSKVDALWTTTESELVGELIIKLLDMFNDTKYNMAKLTGCLICIFREIAQKSSILSCRMKLKLIVFLDAIKKYIKFYDIGLWRNWFLPSMFFDWCFIVACIFMNTKNELKIDLNMSVIRNAEAYYKKVKQCKYLFIQDSKPTKSHKKTGIFELTRIDDLLEIDGVHATNDTNIISNVSVIHSNELEININCMDPTTPGSIVADEVCPVQVCPKIYVRPEFSFSNSFVNKSKWFNGNVNELLKIMNVSMSERSIESSADQNNTTVGNNREPSTVNKRQCANKNATKSKKSKTQIEPPRVFFTVANNSREFDINYLSSSIPQMSNSSSTPQMSSSSLISQMSSSSSVPKKSSSSSVPKKSSSSSAPKKSSTSSIPKKSSSSSVTKKSSSSSVTKKSSSSSVPKKSSSSSVPQMSSLPSTPQMSSSSSFPQMSNSSSIPQMLSSSFPQMSNSSSIPQMSRSSLIPQMSSSSSISRISSSPVVPQTPSSSAAPKNLSSSTVTQNLSPYYNNYSSVNTNSHLPVGLQTVVPRNYSLYYNNLSSNHTQVPIGLKTRPSISITTTQTSNAGGTNSTVEKSATSTQHQFYSHQQNSMHRQHSIASNSQLQRAANTWPPNLYQNLCSDPSCSKSSICHTQYSNSAMSYSQSLYNQNIQSVTSHPQHSNMLTYPTNNYTQPIPSDPLARIAEQVASMNTFMQQQNYNYGNSYLNQNHLQSLDHDTQVSPDLPDARLPNMPNHQDSNTITKTCTAANCTNTSSFPCNTCMAAFYCSTQCQKSDWHYHQNECHLSF